MRDLSLHILDIAQNSIRAKAKVIKILVAQNTFTDRLVIVISDDGCGMSPKYVAQVVSPFTTERTTRSVGLGLPLLAEAAERCGGEMIVSSKERVGTHVYVVMSLSHIDRQPLGSMSDTIISLICQKQECDIFYQRIVDASEFILSTKQVKMHLEDVPIIEPQVLMWLKDYIDEGEKYCLQREVNHEITS